MKTKIIMFGQIAVACFYNEDDYKAFDAPHDSIICEGRVSALKSDDAIKFAPLHPNFMKYYEDAMMPLWKGKGIFSKGTECPVNAVKSYFPKNINYFIAWKPISE